MVTSIVVFGASGDLARRKTFPSLFGLYRRGLLGQLDQFQIIGYARSNLGQEQFKTKLLEFLSRQVAENDAEGNEKLDQFLSLCRYSHGNYDEDQAFSVLATELENFEKTSVSGLKNNRIFYLALPPSAFISAARSVRKHLVPLNEAESGESVRLVVEKPFGHDLQSSQELSAALRPLFSETQIFRIDHYLGKEMVKNLLILRFANIFFNSSWNRGHINNVQIVFKETIGVEGRGGYFDEYGIVRDVMQNHLLQMLALVAMERPASLSAEDIRNEKVKVLRSIRSLRRKDMILGQYSRSEDGKRPGYTEDETVPYSSITPTFAMATLYVCSERWDGVPFVLRCGKGLNEQKAEIRIQFNDVPGALFHDDHNGGDCSQRDDSLDEAKLARNELVLRVQPNEAVYLKLLVKRPGLAMEPMLSELDLSYSSRYSQLRIPDAYESLILDILRGDQSNFVRDDELSEAWRIFTPVLHEIDRLHVIPEAYPVGTRGPKSADDRLLELGYQRSHHHEYNWPQQQI